MKKKELLENDLFRNMPDDTELVFNTSLKCQDCVPVRMADLSFRSEIIAWAKKDIELREKGKDEKEPITKFYLVINTNPY